jgi:hypothetical protein
VIAMRRELVDRAGKKRSRTRHRGDDVGRVDGEQRPYRLSPSVIGHRVPQALDMLPDQQWGIWRKQPVRNGCARHRYVDIRSTQPVVELGSTGFADEVTSGDIRCGKDKATD